MKTRLGANGRRRISGGLTIEQAAERSDVWPKSISTIAVLFATLVGGCSNHYQPLTDADVVSIAVHGTDRSFREDDGGRFTARISGCVSPHTTIWEWGFQVFSCKGREVPAEYDPDTFVVEDDEYGEFELGCDPEGVSDCVSFVRDAKPGRELRFTVNEFYTESKVTMPPVPLFITPKADTHVSSGLDLVLEWEPMLTGDRMHWLLGDGSYEAGEPCAEVDWSSGNGERFGELQDTGSFTIPKETFPTFLPDGGCRVSITIKTMREGSIDPAINEGRIVGEQVRTIEFNLLP
jgi:hypothetical protein